jgi:hypothetical protein
VVLQQGRNPAMLLSAAASRHVGGFQLKKTIDINNRAAITDRRPTNKIQTIQSNICYYSSKSFCRTNKIKRWAHNVNDCNDPVTGQLIAGLDPIMAQYTELITIVTVMT